MLCCVVYRAHRQIVDCRGAATEVFLGPAQTVVGAVQGKEHAADRKACGK
jgi:hypothetical protein